MGDNNISTYQTFLLHSRADRALRVMVARDLDRYGLTMMEWLLLATVCNNDSNGLTMTQVAHELDVTLPQVTALMAQLTKIKLVKQKVSSLDRRSRRLSGTKAGKKVSEEIEASTKIMLDKWLSEVPPEQLATYMNTVQLMASFELPIVTPK